MITSISQCLLEDPANIVETVKCCCGKACKGAKGLKMHQRRWRILEGLNEDPLEIDNSNLGIDSSLDEAERDSHVDMEDIAALHTSEKKLAQY